MLIFFQDMRFLGELQYGTCADPFEGIDSAILQEHYGTEGRIKKRYLGQSGAGHPPDEDDTFNIPLEQDNGSEWVDEDNHNNGEEALEEELDSAPVPPHSNPFSTEDYQTFRGVLQSLNETGYLPEGYGICRDEWDNGRYPTLEVITTGRRGARQLEIGLVDHIWRPRAENWVRALYVFNLVVHDN